MDDHTPIEISPTQLEDMLNRAAERGASLSIKSIGLDDDAAQADVRELRSLLSSWREVRRSALQTVVKVLTTTVVGLILIGLGMQLGAGKLVGGG